MVDADHGLDPLFQKLSHYLELNDDQRRRVLELAKNPTPVKPDTAIVSQGESYGLCGILAKGWAIQYKTLSDGRRQVVNFLLPGTFTSLQATVFGTSDHSISMLTDGLLYSFKPEHLVDLIKHEPVLGMAIVWNRTQEEAILMERLVSLGQRSAKERVAHVLIELWHRLELRGLDDQMKLPFPVGQAILADLLGLTPVHINRTLKTLKQDGLIDYDRKTVSLLDMDTLLEWADFDDSYLHAQSLLNCDGSRLPG